MLATGESEMSLEGDRENQFWPWDQLYQRGLKLVTLSPKFFHINYSQSFYLKNKQTNNFHLNGKAPEGEH